MRDRGDQLAQKRRAGGLGVFGLQLSDALFGSQTVRDVYEHQQGRVQGFARRGIDDHQQDVTNLAVLAPDLHLLIVVSLAVEMGRHHAVSGVRRRFEHIAYGPEQLLRLTAEQGERLLICIGDDHVLVGVIDDFRVLAEIPREILHAVRLQSLENPAGLAGVDG